MKGVGFVFLILLLTAGTVHAGDWSLLQETSITAQVQTVQAANYWGTFQTSLGARWTLGVDWDRWLALRAGLTARSVQTSPIVSNTVYPGYQGSGWIMAADWMPLTAGWLGTAWSAGVSAAVHREFLSYPGLYREFTLPGVTVALAGEIVPGGSSGLGFRWAVPIGIDQREGFWLSWRMGAELGVVFRGVGGTIP